MKNFNKDPIWIITLIIMLMGWGISILTVIACVGGAVYLIREFILK